MEIQAFTKTTELVPMADLTTLAAHRGAFGPEVEAGFSTQAQLRSAAAQAVLDAASQANRDTLLASEQRSYDNAIRERDAVLGLVRTVEQRTEQRAFVPESQRVQTSLQKKTTGLFGIEMRALVEGSGAGAVIAPDAWGPGFFDKLNAQSVALKSGIRVVRTDRDVLHVPRVLADPAANFVAEAGTITPTDPNYDDLAATPRKIATLTQLSNELIADSNPDIVQLLEQQTARALALKFDWSVFEGSGTAPEIRGLKNTAGITTDTSLAAAPASLDGIASAIATIETANGTANAIVMHPRTWGTLSKLKEATGSNKALLQDSSGSGGQAVDRRLYGVPVYLSSQISITEGVGTNESSIYVYDNSAIVAVFRQDTSIVLDRSRLFNSDQSELRAIMRADIVVPTPAAVVRISKVIV